GLLRLGGGDGGLQRLRQALIEQRDARRWLPAGRSEREVRRLAGGAQRLEILRSFSRPYGVRDVDERLRRLADGDSRDDLVLEGIDRHHRLAVLPPPLQP